MREMKKQVYAEELLLHRIATTPVHRCCDYRELLGARAPEVFRDRCRRNEAGGRCVAPLRPDRRRRR